MECLDSVAQHRPPSTSRSFGQLRYRISRSRMVRFVVEKKTKKANAPNLHVRLANQRNALKYAHTITN
jgi:hypothetical protein